MEATILQTGLGLHDEALALIRIATGAFFACSGYNKLFNAGRHAAMRKTLVDDHVPAIRFNEWWVPTWELAAGSSLVIGFSTAFCAVVLMIICLVACVVDAPARVRAYQPINRTDRVADWLYLPEVLYVFMLAITALSGAGKWSLDHFLMTA